jgi:hypothetical protein
MKKKFILAACAALLLNTHALAHIGYTGRNFGTWSYDNGSWSSADVSTNSNVLTNHNSVTISAANLSGRHGWADAADADFGDSHVGRFFRFTLNDAATINFAVTGGGLSSTNYVSGVRLLPGFSIYQGLAHLSPHQASHDSAVKTLEYLNATYPDGSGGTTKEGALNAVGDWAIGNDEGSTSASLRYFTFMGYAVDGTSSNFGLTPGIIGDGNADGFVSKSFNLNPGDYTIYIGGAEYTETGTGNYGYTATFTVVPEPSTLLLSALGLTAVVLWQRSKKMKV